MSETKVPITSNVEISAKVFRAKKVKPRLIPKIVWRFALKRQWPGTGKWGDQEVLASSKKGNINIK
jgi:hypothetical protein